MDVKREWTNIIIKFICLVLLSGTVLSLALADTLWPEDAQRLNVGINLLPACLSADLALQEKLTPDGMLRILVMHHNDLISATTVASGLLELEAIRGFPLQVEIISATSPGSPDPDPVAALFIASPDIQTTVFDHWVAQRQTQVFSPFSGDVERGAVAGLFITDRILPFINPARAKLAGVRYKPFFLRIAKQYDE